MDTPRTREISRARRSRLVAKAQGVPPSPLTFASRRVIENQVGTFSNLPCTRETLPDAQDEEGNFFETPGWSEEGGGDLPRLSVDTLGLTTDSSYATVDRSI